LTTSDDTKLDILSDSRNESQSFSSAGARGVSRTGGASPEVRAALLEEEVTRARAWAICMMVLPSTAAAFTPWMPGELTIRLVFLTASLSYVAVAGFIFWWIRDPERYTTPLFRIWGYTSTVMTAPLVYCLGVFSPTPLIVTLGLSFFGFSRDRKHAMYIALVAVFLYLLLAALIVLEVIPDLGMLSSLGTPRTMLFFFGLMVPMVFAFGIFFSRTSHHALVRAVEQATAAERLVGEREGQLMEVERDLEEMLRVGAGAEGRYTGFSAGAYALGRVIGRGAMGEVYHGRHEKTGEDVAVKLIRLENLGDEERHQRFLREGKIGGELAVPNVVRVFEVGQITDRVPYIAMELLVGDDLRAILRRERKLSLEDVADLCAQIASGIDAAHHAGVVHRDIKPQNLFSHRPIPNKPGTWKLLDFGVSKLADASGTLTQGSIVGTPAYMSPEQARSEAVDHRCDIYGLGAVLYRAITGVAPFRGDSPAKIIYSVVYDMPTRPSEIRAGIPSAVDSVLRIALAKSRGERFDSALDFSDAFQEAVQGNSSHALRKRAYRLNAHRPWGARGGRSEDRTQTQVKRPSSP